MNGEMVTTGIRIDVRTKERISALGKHGDTFNSILVMLLYEHDLLVSLAKEHPDVVQRKDKQREQ